MSRHKLPEKRVVSACVSLDPLINAMRIELIDKGNVVISQLLSRAIIAEHTRLFGPKQSLTEEVKYGERTTEK